MSLVRNIIITITDTIMQNSILKYPTYENISLNFVSLLSYDITLSIVYINIAIKHQTNVIIKNIFEYFEIANDDPLNVYSSLVKNNHNNVFQ